MSFFFLFFNQGSVQGVSGTGGVGSEHIEIDASVVGTAGTGQVGSPGLELDERPSVAGVAGFGQIGSPSTEVDASLTGCATIGQAGLPAVEIDGSVLGIVGTGQCGSLSIGVDASGIGIVGIGQIGTPSIEIDASVSSMAGAGNVGSLGPGETPSLAGVVAIGQAGSPSIEADASSNGCAAFGQVASLAIEIDGTVVGASSSAQPGSLANEIDVSTTGVIGNGLIGSPSIEVDDTASIAGVSCIGQSGSPNVEIDASGLGVAGAGQAGMPAIERDQNAGVAGIGSNGQVGSTGIETDASGLGGFGAGQSGLPRIEVDASLAGVGSVGEAGSAGAGQGFSIAVSGLSGTGQVGSSLAAETEALLTGVSGDGVGSPIADVEPMPTGAGGIGHVGSFAIDVDASAIGVEATSAAGTADITVGDVDQIIVSLYSDDGGVPGTFIEVIGTFFDAAVSTAPTTITLSPSNPIPLEPNTRYWVQVTNSNTTSVRWVNLDNDSGTGVAPEFWYKSTGDSGANDSSPAYQMAVLSEVVIGAGGTGQIGSLSIQFSAITSASGIAGSGQAGSLVSDVIVPLTGVAGIGHPGTPTLSGAKRIKRSGRGADNKNFKPALFSKPPERETDAEAMARWRRVVDELLEIPPRQAEGTEQPEPDRPVEPEKDFAFLNNLPKPTGEYAEPIIEPTNWQAIAEADDALLLGECLSGPEADDLLLLGDWL